ncbi:MAG: acetyltransferase, partial [Pontibacter sp.]|nr:acetyltransferase [Pontibacter sp.]
MGASGLGREILVLLHQINDVQPTWNILGFYDDDPTLAGTSINNQPYLGTVAELQQAKSTLSVAVAVGSPKVKEQIVNRLQQNAYINFPVIVHPLSLTQPYQQVTIGQGTIISRGCVLTSNIGIGEHVFINLNCTIGHDVSLKNYTALMPGAN